jgi:uncharacterized membrane protein
MAEGMPYEDASACEGETIKSVQEKNNVKLINAVLMVWFITSSFRLVAGQLSLYL